MEEASAVEHDDSATFGQRLRRMREAAGLTQAELAERAGISVKAVGALESGRRQRPYPSTVRALADALNLSDSERALLTGAVPDRPRASTAAVTAPTATTGLPVPPTPVIGRERELVEIEELLSSGARLITLTGPGGVGKTRLALEAARRASSATPGTAAFIPLAPLNDPALVLVNVAHTLGLREGGDGPLPARLAEHVAGQRWLLVLDNAEHLLDAATELAALLEAAPEITLIVTSRAPLRIRAEHEYPLRPMALPDLTRIPTVEEVAAASAVQLFLDRARAAVPGFELTQANCAAVAAICRRLDGLPLALELVGARLRALSPTDLLARLEDGLPVLTGGSRDLPERQQTMEAAINWSYQLIASAEQAVFRRLAVFAGGWSLDAAEQVAAWGDVAADQLIELLTGLVEQSLVVAGSDPEGATRYWMLETIRQFARQQAEAAGEFEHVRDRHLAWSLSYAQRATPALRGPEQQLWLDRLEREHDNMRAALEWAGQKAGRKKYELLLATALWRFWETRGYVTEGRRWLDQALAQADRLPARLRADALNAAGNLARDQGDLEQATAHHEASLELRRKAKDATGIARSLINLGNVTLDQGKYVHARVLYTEALERFRELDNDWDVANALNNLGIVSGYLGEYAEATALLEEALELRTKLGEAASRARTLDALGVVVRRQGDLARAAALHEESLALRREIGEPRGIAIALMNLGQVARYHGDFAEAARLIAESLEIRRDVEDKFGVAVALNALADVARLQGDSKRASTLYREALALQRQLGMNDGLADSLVGLAAIALERDDAARAARLLAASEGLRASMSQPVAPVDRAAYEELAAAIRGRLDDQQFEREQAEGHALSGPEAIEYALAMP